MDNPYLVALLLWPGVALLCAGINMLISWTFSWSELVFVYLAGTLAGYFLFAASTADPHGLELFLFVFSHGLVAGLYVLLDGLRDALDTPAALFWTLAAVRVGATLWAAAWDRLAGPLGASFTAGPFLLGLLIAPAKLPFALVTSAVGLLIWLAGAVWAAAGRGGRVAFAGGVFIAEFDPTARAYHATTLGFTVQTWFGRTPFEHELYHTRQYIYLSDWLIPFWCLGTLWGLVSAAISPHHSPGAAMAFGADPAREVGNPLEVAAYRL